VGLTKVIHFPANVEGVQTRKDRTLKISVGTLEMTAEESAQVFSMNQMQGWVSFSLNPIEMQDIPDEPPTEFKSDKSPSQRLRSALFVWWEQGDKKTPFDSFYRQRMEDLITWVKGKLDQG